MIKVFLQSQKRCPLLSLAVLLFILVGCSTTTAELKSNTDHMEVWEISAPNDQVFRVYKDYSEENFSYGDFLGGSGQRVKGYYYGPEAELSIRYEGNPLAQMTNLHFEFSKREENTIVKVWYLDGSWKRTAEKFKKLLPTKVVSSP